MQKTKLILAAAGFSAMAFVTSCTSQQSLVGSPNAASSGNGTYSNATAEMPSTQEKNVVEFQTTSPENNGDVRASPGNLPKFTK